MVWLWTACAPMPMQPQPLLDVAGRITTPLGDGLAEMQLYFEPQSQSARSFFGWGHARTDSLGHYALQLYPGTYEVVVDLDITESHGDYSVGIVYRDRVTFTSSRTRLDLAIAGHLVTGRVRDPLGADLDSGFVGASAPGPYDSGIYTSTSVRAGRFAVFLPAGVYDFAAYSRDYYSGFPWARIEGIPVYADTSIELTMTGDPVTGIVTGPEGPLVDVLVIASGEIASRVRTSADGRYRLYVPPASYRFFLEPGPANRHILTRVTSLYPVAGPTTMDFHLTGPTWSGWIREEGAGAPLPNRRVSAVMFGDSYGRAATDTTDASGAFTLVLEPGREYSLSVYEPGESDPRFTIPAVFASADTTFDLVLDPLPAP
jgi:hypothetical protein